MSSYNILCNFWRQGMWGKVQTIKFQDPLPPTPWKGIKDTSKEGGIAAQFDALKLKFIGGDDCLYLNVYTQSLETTYPVMVWIHSGGFVSGSGNESYYGPDYLIDKNIVLVTINYRLGVLGKYLIFKKVWTKLEFIPIVGFLNLEDEVAPGNQGLKDQIMALKWVQKNIKNFGGDPKNVTIFGGSAGGSSVHYLTLSRLSQGDFLKT